MSLMCENYPVGKRGRHEAPRGSGKVTKGLVEPCRLCGGLDLQLN